MPSNKRKAVDAVDGDRVSILIIDACEAGEVSMFLVKRNMADLPPCMQNAFTHKNVFHNVCFQAGVDECDELVIPVQRDDREELEEDEEIEQAVVDALDEAENFVEDLLHTENLYIPSPGTAPTHVITLVEK